MRKLEIYTSKTCEWCTETKNYLIKNNISFIDKEIDDNDEEWKTIVTITGMETTPTLVYGGRILIPGRDYNDIEEIPFALNVYKNIYQESSFLTFEKLKSFEYNISEALQHIISELEELKTISNEHKSTS